MPFFDERPEVFPPIVAPAGKFGHVPAFAQAVGEDVVAWSPPDGFRYREYDYVYSFRRVSDNARLSVHTMFRFDGEQRSAREQIEWDALESLRRTHDLVAASAGPNPYVRVTPIHDEVTRVTAGADELRVDWWGTFSGGGKGSEGGTQAVTVFVLDSPGKACAISVEAESERGRNERWSIADVRAQLLDASSGRVPFRGGAELRLWTPEANFALGVEWTRPSDSSDFSATWDPDPSDLSVKAATVELRPIALRSEDDLLALANRELRALDDLHAKGKITRSNLPSYGHVFVAARELKRDTVNVMPDPDEEPDPMEPGPYLYQGETIRLAAVAVGRDRAVTLRLSIGDWAAEQLEDLWRQCLERLYVTYPVTQEPTSR